jgi:ADP-ribose pyrophosphatase YjhB (NUDIX family)
VTVLLPPDKLGYVPAALPGGHVEYAESPEQAAK